MKKYYADLHVHIGEAVGQPVKVTASRRLTVEDLVKWGAKRKGLDIIGVVDAASPPVMNELEALLKTGDMEPVAGGGLLGANGLLLLLGAEIETEEGAHFLCYLPDIRAMKEFQRVIGYRVSNLNLSTPKARLTARELVQITSALGGIFCPAHAFTPHKGAYGCWVERLASGLGDDVDKVEALELGLSADSCMAAMISETDGFCLLSNSDAHSLESLGREYNCLLLDSLNFTEVQMAVRGEKGRQVLANYGMHPMLGKYHRTYCPECQTIAGEPAPVTECFVCGNRRVVLGVWDRICQMRDRQEKPAALKRIPYHYRVPLLMLPGIGRQTLERMVRHLGSEIEIAENARIEDIARIAGPNTAEVIDRMRQGRLMFSPGGGGRYGKVQKD